MGKEIRKVLIVDDEESIRELLMYNLEQHDYKVKTAADGEEALKIAASFTPDVVLLDIMMPKQDGIETCRQLKAMSGLANTYILFLTARSEEYSEIAAFEVGADDYIVKPIKPRALLSRIDAIFRRHEKKEKELLKIEIADLVIDRGRFCVTKKNGEVISLPKKEFKLLFFLAKKPHQVFTRDDLLRNIWGEDVYVVARTIDVHIRKLREKIGEHYITTIKGVGYKFNL